MIVVCVCGCAQKHNKFFLFYYYIYLLPLIHFNKSVIWFSMFLFCFGFFFSFLILLSSSSQQSHTFELELDVRLLFRFIHSLFVECNLSCVVQYFFHFLATICHDATYRIIRTRWSHKPWILAMIFWIWQCCMWINLHDVRFKVCRLIAWWIILMKWNIVN